MEQLPALYRLAFHLARNQADAEDLVQETFLRALRAQGTFNLGAGGIKPWLLRILHNVFLTKLKRAKLEPVSGEIAEDLAQSSETDAALTGQTLAELDWEQVDARLKQAIQGLPEAYRMVFLLSAVEDLKYREIAEVLEMPMGTVMSRLYRARAMLLEELAGLASELGMSAKSAQERMKNDDEGV